MTRKEAIKGLKVLRRGFSGYKPIEEMFDIAIQALEQEPKPSDVARDIATIIENEQDMRVIALQREPIIHCKDCKYWDKWEIGQAVCRRSENGCFRFGVDADDYCSFAERRAEQ